MRGKYGRRDEPGLEDLLSYPMIWTMMRSDNVGKDQLRNLLRGWRRISPHDVIL